MTMTLDELEAEVISELTVELREDDNFSDTILAGKVRQAIREVKRARRYPSYYTDDMISADMEAFESNVYNIALYEYNQVGMDSQKSHSENGVSRTFVDKPELFAGIIPLAVV